MNFEDLRLFSFQWKEQKPDAIQIGDELVLSLPDLDSFKLEVPEGSDSLIKQGWHIKKIGPKDIALIPLTGGTKNLPSLLIKSDTGESLGRTEPLTLEVLNISEQEKGSEAPAFYPPVSYQFPLLEAGLIGTGFTVLLVLLVYYLIKYFKNKPKKHFTLPNLPPQSPLERAISRVNALEAEGLIDKKEYKKLYFGLSEIFKEFLGAIHHFDATESTTDELLFALNKIERAKPQLKDIETYFRNLDIVKFTDHIPPKAEAKEAIYKIRVLLENQKEEVGPVAFSR